MSLSLLSLLLVSVVAVALSVSSVSGQSSGSVCIILFGAPGNVEYPWTSAAYLDFTYQASSNPNAVLLLSGSGYRNFTNKYGQSYVSSLVLDPVHTDYSDNLLFTDGTVVDTDGITYTLSPPIQYPGHGPNALVSTANIYTDGNGDLVEQDAFIIDDDSISVTSSLSPFVPVSPSGCPSNKNCFHYDTTACLSWIDSDNYGQTPPTTAIILAAQQPVYNYSYYISDGATYSVTTNVTLTIANGPPGIMYTTPLGDYVLNVTNISGSRVYEYPLGTILTTSSVAGGSLSAYPLADQFIYPFALGQQPTWYTMNNAPFLDYDGIEFGVTPMAYMDGSGTGTRYPAVNAFVYGSETDVAIEESHSRTYPNPAFQQQTLTQYTPY